jgi:excisionase family DNA binding protein
MTVSEFCSWARIGRTKLYAEVKDGRITLRKIGSKTIILRSDAEAWLHSLPVAV